MTIKAAPDAVRLTQPLTAGAQAATFARVNPAHALDHRPPNLVRFMREFAAFAGLRARTYMLREYEAAAAATHPPVIVIPGFLASDFSTRPFRHALARAGLHVHGWGLGVNRGAQADTLEQLDTLIERVSPDQRAVLVGWSFGGLMARELAKRHPDQVKRVITMGTPFSGQPRANNLWRLYEWVNGYDVTAPPLPVRLHEKPPVPTVALWSRGDGIVAPACARGLPHEADRHIEVDCTHVGFMTCRKVVKTVCDLVAE